MANSQNEKWMGRMESIVDDMREAEEQGEARRSAADCSASSFEWIMPEDPRWEQWCAWDEKILVMTSEGPVVVRVPENGYPWYHCFDDEEIAEPEEWTAWSRIPCIQNASVEGPLTQAPNEEIK